MTKPLFVPRRRALTASLILEAVGDDLQQIKREDGLTLEDIGRVVGKSADQAGKYCLGNADMGLVSFTLAKQAWNGRITGTLDRLIADVAPTQTDDRTRLGVILRAAMVVASALEDDNQMDADEVRASRSTLEEARAEIDALLGRLKPKVAA